MRYCRLSSVLLAYQAIQLKVSFIQIAEQKHNVTVLRCAPIDTNRCKVRGKRAPAVRPALAVPFQARPKGRRNGTPREASEGQ
jgi:hypothetical protein